MRDLCQVCKNFNSCVFGEGTKIDPKVTQAEEISDDGEHLGCWDVVECDHFEEYEENLKKD
ncbi:MAG: hypothetical protein ACFFDT_31455 [Candidatus Hodarchaeota archaeon]